MSNERQRAAKIEMRKPITKFEKIDLSVARYVPQGMTRAYRNTRYTVMIYDHSPTDKGESIRVMVQRHDDKPIPFHWSEMQKIKNQIFGNEVTAIEYYPAESRLQDVHNIYWFWIFEDGIIPIPIIS